MRTKINLWEKSLNTSEKNESGIKENNFNEGDVAIKIR